MTTKCFPAEMLWDLMGDEDHISTTRVDERRRYAVEELVFLIEGEHWKVIFYQGLTEHQYSDFPRHVGYPEMVKATKVKPVEKVITTTVWEPV